MTDFVVYAMMLGGLSTGPSLPFWATANQYGLYPESNGGITQLAAYSSFDESKAFQYRMGCSLAARVDCCGKYGGVCYDFIPDEAFVSLRWKVLNLDLGIKHDPQDFLASSPTLGSLSTTGGHLTWSGNARSMPGYNLVLDPWAVPGTKGILTFFGSFGDYKTLDTRYVEGTLVHRTKLFAKLTFGRFAFTFGVDHYSLWGGTIMPVTFENYFRIITGQSAAAGGGSQSDQMNALGDHGGSELLRFDWRGDGWKLTFMHEIPYSDRSGMRFQNFPDGMNTLAFSFDRKDRWVTDILYEFGYTMYQSGSIHDPEVDEHGNPIPWQPGMNFIGMDDYYNNGEYKSGWTHFGRPITAALFYPAGTKDGSWNRNTVTLGIENNRFISNHIGLSGKFFRKAPYKLMLTYTLAYGTYNKSYAGESPQGKPWGSVQETPLTQFSGGLTGEINDIFHLKGLTFMYGIYGDVGQVLSNCFGGTIGLRYIIPATTR